MRRSEFLTAFFVFAIALGVRLVRLGERSFWLDEAFGPWLANQPFDAIINTVDPNPPLYYLLLKLWGGIPGLASDAGLRLLSAIPSALAIAWLYALVGRLGFNGGRFVAVLGIVSPIAVWYGQEARSYALTTTTFLVSASILAIVAKRGTWSARLWLAYVGALLAALYLHYDAIPLAIAANVLFALFCRPHHSLLWQWLAANGTVALLYLPEIAHLRSGALATILGSHEVALGLAITGQVIGGAGILVWLAVSFALILLLLVGQLAIMTSQRPSWRKRAVVAAASFVIVGLGMSEITPQGALVKRHISIISPIALCLAGVAIAEAGIRNRWKAVLVSASLPALALVLFAHQKEDWRGLAGLLTTEERPGDVIVLYQGYQYPALARYFRGQSRVIAVASPADLGSTGAELSAAPRVWLVEGHTTDPPSLAPHLQAGRAYTYERSLYRIAITRLDRVD